MLLRKAVALKLKLFHQLSFFNHSPVVAHFIKIKAIWNVVSSYFDCGLRIFDCGFKNAFPIGINYIYFYFFLHFEI